MRVKEHEFTNYILAFRLITTDEETDLINKHNMRNQEFIRLRSGDALLTFADVLTDAWVAEVQPSQQALLQAQAALTAACVTWTRFFESLNH